MCEFLGFSGLELFRAKGWLRSFTFSKGLGFLTVLRFFVVRVYIRVSYCLCRVEVFGGFTGVLHIGLVRVVYGFEGFSVFYGFEGFCD